MALKCTLHHSFLRTRTFKFLRKPEMIEIFVDHVYSDDHQLFQINLVF